MNLFFRSTAKPCLSNGKWCLFENERESFLSLTEIMMCLFLLSDQRDKGIGFRKREVPSRSFSGHEWERTVRDSPLSCGIPVFFLSYI